MKTFLNKLRKLSRRQSKKFAALPARRKALLAAAVLVMGIGIPVAVHAWIIYPSMSYSAVYTGSYTYVSWSAPTSDFCGLTGGAPISGETCYPPTVIFGITLMPGFCGYRVNGASGSAYTGPINGPTTYNLSCINESGGLGSSQGSGSASITVYPTTPARSTPYISVSPANINPGQSSTIYWSTSAGSTYSTAYVFGGGLDRYVSSSGSLPTGVLNASTQYGYEVYDSYYGWETPVYKTVAVHSPPTMTSSVTSTAGSASTGGTLTVPFGTLLNVSSTYAAGSGDTLTSTVLNVLPPSPGAEYNANYTTPYNQSSRAYSFTPAAAGTYIIKPYITTTYSGGWLNMPADNITVTVLPAPPTPTITASPTTVDLGGTSALSWSTSNLAAGQCSLTAPSSGSSATNFGSITGGTKTANYYAANAVVNGWAYSIAGYNGSAYTTTVYKAPASSDLTNASNWSAAGSIPTAVAIFDKPLLVGSNLWSFGGVANTSGGMWTSTICYVPVGTGTLGAWSCPASLPTGAAQGYADPIIIGDYIYRFGGYNNTTYAGPVSSVSRAPLSSPSSWTRYTNVLPQTNGMYGQAVAVIGSYVYLFGGYNGTATLNTIYRASITSDLTLPSSWTSGGVLPATVTSAEVAVDGDYVYLIGGTNGGTAVNTIYRIPLGTLAGGGVTAGSWSSAGTLPVPLNRTQSLIVNDKLYLMGGWQNGVYVNKVYSLPFNDGLPYTTPANLPWHTNGGTNSATTWPITANTTFTLQCTNASGSNSASATVTIPDACTDISGFQSALPPGCTGPVPSPSGICIPTGYMYDGSACIVAPPSISSFFGPGRVRSGNTAVLKYTVSNPPASCTITGTDGFSASVSPSDGVQGSVTTTPITSNTVFTLTCDGVSLSATVGITPAYQEL